MTSGKILQDLIGEFLIPFKLVSNLPYSVLIGPIEHSTQMSCYLTKIRNLVLEIQSYHINLGESRQVPLRKPSIILYEIALLDFFQPSAYKILAHFSIHGSFSLLPRIRVDLNPHNEEEVSGVGYLATDCLGGNMSFYPEENAFDVSRAFVVVSSFSYQILPW